MGQALCQCSIGGAAASEANTKLGAAERASRAKKIEKFMKKLQTGVSAVKLSCTHPPSRVVLLLRGSKLHLEGAVEGDAEAVPRDISGFTVRRGIDPDPEAGHLAGTQALRENMMPQDAMKAFVLEFDPQRIRQQTPVEEEAPEQVIPLSFSTETEEEAEAIVEGFKLLSTSIRR